MFCIIAGSGIPPAPIPGIPPMPPMPPMPPIPYIIAGLNPPGIPPAPPIPMAANGLAAAGLASPAAATPPPREDASAPVEEVETAAVGGALADLPLTTWTVSPSVILYSSRVISSFKILPLNINLISPAPIVDYFLAHSSLSSKTEALAPTSTSN